MGRHKRTGRGTGNETEFPIIEISDISHNVVLCPVNINDHGVEYEGTLLAGQVAFEAEQAAGEAYPTIRPRNDWCVAMAEK